ncbi:hypothetical protein [Nocardia sp. NPDC004604]|uniref:hypothetical protein n=1 Tax=Nocardia sp. NPDC004604 TaxID=3157013 RepID=UPI0033B36660
MPQRCAGKRLHNPRGGLRRRVRPAARTPRRHRRAELILIEPFLLPISGIVEVGNGYARLDEEGRKKWRADLDPKSQVVREIARKYDAHLLAADGMFAELAATTGRWTPAGATRRSQAAASAA